MNWGVRMASNFLNGNTARIIGALLLLLMSTGIIHVFAKIDDNAVAIQQNADNIRNLSIKIERFIAKSETTDDFYRETLTEIKERLKELDEKLDKIRSDKRS